MAWKFLLDGKKIRRDRSPSIAKQEAIEEDGKSDFSVSDEGSQVGQQLSNLTNNLMVNVVQKDEQ